MRKILQLSLFCVAAVGMGAGCGGDDDKNNDAGVKDMTVITPTGDGSTTGGTMVAMTVVSPEPDLFLRGVAAGMSQTDANNASGIIGVSCYASTDPSVTAVTGSDTAMMGPFAVLQVPANTMLRTGVVEDANVFAEIAGDQITTPAAAFGPVPCHVSSKSVSTVASVATAASLTTAQIQALGGCEVVALVDHAPPDITTTSSTISISDSANYDIWAVTSFANNAVAVSKGTQSDAGSYYIIPHTAVTAQTDVTVTLSPSSSTTAGVTWSPATCSLFPNKISHLDIVKN